MAPFIRYTEISKVGGEERAAINLVNAAFISHARFTESDGNLQLTYQRPSPDTQQAFGTARLVGEEAKEAFELLKSLK